MRLLADIAFRDQRARELEELRNEITEPAGHLNAANYRFLKLIVVFDRRNGRFRKHAPTFQLERQL